MTNALFMLPVNTQRVDILGQAWLQGLSWSETTREADLAKRNSRLQPVLQASSCAWPLNYTRSTAS